jgi:hypothetical protein
MASELEFSEWQYPRVASFLPLILLVPAVWLVGAPFNTDIGALVGLLIAGIATFMKLSNSKHIKVSKDSLQLGSAIIPREFLGEISEISKSEQFDSICSSKKNTLLRDISINSKQGSSRGAMIKIARYMRI